MLHCSESEGGNGGDDGGTEGSDGGGSLNTVAGFHVLHAQVLSSGWLSDSSAILTEQGVLVGGAGGLSGSSEVDSSETTACIAKGSISLGKHGRSVSWLGSAIIDASEGASSVILGAIHAGLKSYKGGTIAYSLGGFLGGGGGGEDSGNLGSHL